MDRTDYGDVWLSLGLLVGVVWYVLFMSFVGIGCGYVVVLRCALVWVSALGLLC